MYHFRRSGVDADPGSAGTPGKGTLPGKGEWQQDRRADEIANDKPNQDLRGPGTESNLDLKWALTNTRVNHNKVWQAIKRPPTRP